MHTLYITSRRVIASVLALAMVLYTIVGFCGVITDITWVLLALSAIGVALLGTAVLRDTPVLGFDITSFFLTGAVTAMWWTFSDTAWPAATYLPTIVVAIVYATWATVLRAELDAATTQDRW